MKVGLRYGDPERIRTADLLRDREACWTATPRGRGSPVYIRLLELGANQRFFFPDHKALDHLRDAGLLDSARDVFGH
jgi:hypothetical protein